MTVPAFTLPEITGEQEWSLEDFQGKPLLLTFWVSWCPDCQRDLEAKRTLYEAMTSSELQVVMIHVPGREGSREAGLEHYEKQEYPFLSLQDDGQKTYDAYQAMTLPTTVVVNKNGGLEAKFHDKSSIQEMMPAIANVMM
ncbi:TlpA disulfide reductase family protein [Alkalicoccus chagannorensis]|uniref:TlpA disulfide reductase family protein n=1 Tax=Alkalicoccus chagannorensis TaxID=427072 RepID=UPI0003F69E53|nr:TlpA disulfide reductase family protein [Alkalicoccus chagannorensis]